MRLKQIALAAVALLGVTVVAAPTAVSATGSNPKVPHYKHIVEIMMENQKYGTIIGNPLAPADQRLGQQVRAGHELLRRDPSERAQLHGQPGR